MNHHDGFRHEVFVPQPRQRELSYWLSEDAVRYASPGVTTALRTMAWNRGQLRGMAGAALGAGVSFMGLGVLSAATVGGLGFFVGLSAPGMALVLMGMLVFRRLRQRRLPGLKEMAPSRGPGNVASGIGTGIFFTAIAAGCLYPAAAMLLDRGPAGIVLLAGYALMTLIFFGSVFAVPSYFIEHAVRHFRADIEASPELRESLEGMSLSWRDPVGTREFGPL